MRISDWSSDVCSSDLLIDHLDHVSSASYPSGHATSAAVVYLLLAWLAPPRWRFFAWALAAAMIVLNGFSRIMLGVHWASDIAGGTMLGARSEEHTSELQSLMRSSYAVFCFKKKT